MRPFAHAIVIGIPALLGAASAVHAANTNCSGNLGGSVPGNIVVPSGASCTPHDRRRRTRRG